MVRAFEELHGSEVRVRKHDLAKGVKLPVVVVPSFFLEVPGKKALVRKEGDFKSAEAIRRWVGKHLSTSSRTSSP